MIKKSRVPNFIAPSLWSHMSDLKLNYGFTVFSNKLDLNEQ